MLRPLRLDTKKLLVLLSHNQPRLTIAGGVLTLLEAVFAFGVFYAVKLLIDALNMQLGSESSECDTHSLFLFLALVGGTTVSALVVQSLASLMRTAQGMSVGEYVDRAIHDRAISVGPQALQLGAVQVVDNNKP